MIGEMKLRGIQSLEWNCSFLEKMSVIYNSASDLPDPFTSFMTIRIDYQNRSKKPAHSELQDSYLSKGGKVS